ncbi:unnamed protein product [Cladocopium goreaui]|uniref:Uncharacterized protein n=1 Tax=Cladocopium goreaui TaxID=2562237 RepID=A0A9P1M1T3_9DINO|nr:unnamed protein product [Cladocopium goreaui]
MIREDEQQRLGVWLDDDEESGGENEEFQEEEEGQPPGEEQSTVNGVAHIRRMTLEEFNNGMEESGESEMEEIEGEVDPGAEAGGDRECKMEQEQKEEESDDDMETDYGSVGMVDEDFSVFEELEPIEYDDLTRKPSRISQVKAGWTRLALRGRKTWGRDERPGSSEAFQNFATARK